MGTATEGRINLRASQRLSVLKDLSGCSQCAHGTTCTRCPGLAFMEGNMRGPSTADCEKSFARTGIPSVNLLSKKEKPAAPRLVQIQIVPAISGNRLSGIGVLPASVSL